MQIGMMSRLVTQRLLSTLTLLIMRKLPIILLPLTVFFIGIIACKTDDHVITDTVNKSNNPTDTMSDQPPGSSIRIRIDSRTFRATLLDNPTVTAFKARLPLTISMSELNGNEKLYNFPTNLPTNASNPGTIHTGDLMLYGSNTLVLFYKSFPTPYSYTKLGRIDNPAELAATVGTGRITATFDLE
jgi:hypothetical protein